MRALKIVEKFMTNPIIRFGYLSKIGIFNSMPDEEYLKRRYKLTFNKELDLENPQTFNEKLQWLKLNDRKPEYTIMVDKYAVKKYVADKIGEQYIIPTLGVWDSFDEIDFNCLPNQFVLKCTHDSGGLVICRDKSKLDIKSARKKINKCLKRNFFYGGREWPYKNVKPRIIAEKYMTDESGIELKDYKVFNFGGTPEIIEVDFGRFKEHKRNLYDTDWQYIEAAIQYPTASDVKIDRPQQLEQMLKLAKILSKDIPFVRTDFYSIEDRLYFGELTFFHGSGFEKITPKRYEKLLGEKINIRTNVHRGGGNFAG